ncbi:MAG TPA: GspH/FimT family pseudopilin [Gammaproteobacteria bacterium]|jgi:type IV fimbrial biogenesis protein FimT
MRTGKHLAGFTIIELMLTLAIMATILTLAGPSFRNMIADTRLTTTTNSFISAVTLAKSEAISRKTTVHLSAQLGGTSTWGNGWIIWADGDGDNTPDYPGEYIRVFPPASGTVVANNSPALQETDDDRPTVSFTPNGLRTPGGVAGNITLTICDDRSDEVGRQIIISLIGRTSLNRTYAGCNS